MQLYTVGEQNHSEPWKQKGNTFVMLHLVSMKLNKVARYNIALENIGLKQEKTLTSVIRRL